MADAPYAFNEADLHNIVDKTQSAIDELNTVNGIVQMHTEDLGTANQSDSGDILQDHLNTWTTDFHTCVNNLSDLNGKAQGLLQVNVDVATGSRDQAH
jgi:DNA integrity scanning protein DisA with diadenylate cyclase activity